jgi:hypothetical protein
VSDALQALGSKLFWRAAAALALLVILLPLSLVVDALPRMDD